MKVKRAKTSITYHGRTGKPLIHCASGVRTPVRPYIMVRAKGGGTQKLHLNTDKASREITKGYTPLLREAMRHCQRQQKKSN